jgi:hypothetical protein
MAERFDLEAIEADDALLDLLAAGGETAWAAAEHDPALMLLAELRLAVEVEDELPVETIDDPESFLARCAALHPVNDQFAKKMAARGLALGVAAVAALSISGVAAAVNGDPLSPYEKVIEKVVNGLSPETTFPKEKLDGLAPFNKSKIVKVQKNYETKQQEQQAAQEAADKKDPAAGGDLRPAIDITPPLARPAVPELPTTTKVDPPVDPPAVDPTQPADPGGDPTTPSGDPTDPPSTTPTDPPSTTPTDPPSTTPTDPPSSEPTSDPSKGTTGEGSSDPSAGTTTVPPDPTTAPTGDTGDGQTGNGQTSNGQTGSGDIDQPSETVPGGDTQPGDSKDSTPVALPTGDLPTGDVPTDDVTGVTLSEVLPTPSGEPTDVPRLEQYFGGSLAAHAKHSNGKVALGYAKSKYQAGKHSNGKYSEGKHAAIARAHGSMAPMTLRQILTVLNGPMSGR